MKKLIFFFLLLLLFPVLADTDRATLKIGQSFFFDGYNFTVINLSPRTDSAVFCVNDQKVIFVEDKVKTYSSDDEFFNEMLGEKEEDE